MATKTVPAPPSAATISPKSRVLPLSERKLDYAFIGFFVINLLVITYIIDIEQLTIPQPNPVPGKFTYPSWPPHAAVDIIHAYGRSYDPLLMARPTFWKMTIWIDVLYFGTFYIAAIYAFIKGHEWIRFPAFIYAGAMTANVVAILFEECYGVHASPKLLSVLALNMPWLTIGPLLAWRLRNSRSFQSIPDVVPNDIYNSMLAVVQMVSMACVVGLALLSVSHMSNYVALPMWTRACLAVSIIATYVGIFVPFRDQLLSVYPWSAVATSMIILLGDIIGNYNNTIPTQREWMRSPLYIGVACCLSCTCIVHILYHKNRADHRAISATRLHHE